MQQAGVPGPPDAPANLPGAPDPPPGPEEPLGPDAPPDSTFRAVNETIYDTALDMAERPDSTVELLCECGHARCLALVEMTLADYDTVRSMPNCFLVRDGHDAPWIHQVVERAEGYLIVERRLSAGP